MNRLLFFLAFALLVGRGFSQNLDSLAATKQVDSLIQVSRALTGKGDFDKALEVNAAAEKLALEKLGRESAAYGSCCNNRGRVLFFNVDYPESEKWYLESLSIREKILGNEHADYAETLMGLGAIYQYQRNFIKAEPLFLQSLGIRKKRFGMESKEYINSLTRLLWVYIALSRFEEAQTYCLQFQELEEKMNGKNHPDYAQSQYYLAILFQNMSRFEAAEPRYLEAKRIFETAPGGKQHPFYLQNLDGLGGLYHFMGRHAEAEPLWAEVRDIREKRFGKQNESYALSLVNMGMIYSRTNRPEQAEASWLEAKDIYEKRYGTEHYMVAACKTNLGLLYSESGRYAEAEQFLFESIITMEKTGNDALFSYLNLARLYELQARFEDAERNLLKALASWRTLAREDDPEFVKYGIHFLAYVYERQGKYAQADSLLRNGSKKVRDILTKSATYLSEKELGNYLHLFENLGNHLLSFVTKGVGEHGWFENANTETFGYCYDQALFYKGFLLYSSQKIKNQALFDTASVRQFHELATLKNQLAKEYSLQNTASETFKALESKANFIEKELAKSVAGFGNALQQVTGKDVQKRLAKTAVAIEFVSYQFGEWAYVTDSILYAALILLPGAEHPKFIPLFEEKQLAQLLAANTEGQSFAQVYASRGVKPVQAAGKLAGLYDLIWKPLKKHLKGAKTVYYSPAGLLHRINFDAIPVGKKGTLSDQFQLVRLGSTRSLAVPDLTKTEASAEAMLFGGIQYEPDTTRLRDSIAPAAVLPLENSPEWSFSSAARSLQSRGETWDYLPGTATEVSEIQALFQQSNVAAQVFSGENASEEAFKLCGKSKNSPRILHLATHGFFFPDPKTGVDGNQPAFKMSDHPMIRSGLILAGGNLAWQTGKPLKPGMDDGILTAYEISQLDLSNTELVVLSACETGLGDIQGNEGVYGLQRAFKIAGAKYLIMSLWQVPDRQTSLLMTTFYKKWLADKLPIPEAFRAAQKELREAGLDPYQWAGFVLVE